MQKAKGFKFMWLFEFVSFEFISYIHEVNSELQSVYIYISFAELKKWISSTHSSQYMIG